MASYDDFKKQIEILAVDENQAGAMVGRKSVLDLMLKANWLAPICTEHKCVLYSVEAVKLAFRKWIQLGHENLKKQAQERA